MNQKVKNKNKDNSSNSLVFGRWPQTIINGVWEGRLVFSDGTDQACTRQDERKTKDRKTLQIFQRMTTNGGLVKYHEFC